MHVTHGGITYQDMKHMKLSELQAWQVACNQFMTPQKRKDRILEAEYEEAKAELIKNQKPKDKK